MKDQPRGELLVVVGDARRPLHRPSPTAPDAPFLLRRKQLGRRRRVVVRGVSARARPTQSYPIVVRRLQVAADVKEFDVGDEERPRRARRTTSFEATERRAGQSFEVLGVDRRQAMDLLCGLAARMRPRAPTPLFSSSSAPTPPPIWNISCASFARCSGQVAGHFTTTSRRSPQCNRGGYIVPPRCWRVPRQQFSGDIPRAPGLAIAPPLRRARALRAIFPA